MAKSQHEKMYQVLPPLLKAMREKANLSQRAIGERLIRPQSYVHNCEVMNRRVDITEFIAWAKACGIQPEEAFSDLLELLDTNT